MTHKLSRHQRRKLRMQKLFDRQGGLCCYCHRPMLFDHNRRGGWIPWNAATLEHFDDRLSPERGKHGGTVRTALACRRCNETRGNARVKELPPEELWRRSGRPPQRVAQRIEQQNSTLTVGGSNPSALATATKPEGRP